MTLKNAVPFFYCIIDISGADERILNDYLWKVLTLKQFGVHLLRHHDTQHNDIQYNDTQHNNKKVGHSA